MMIVFVNSKGGVGKSTLASHFALWAHDLGISTALLDTDKQESSSDWLVEAEPQITIRTADNPDQCLERALQLQAEHRLVIGDGPAGLDVLPSEYMCVPPCDSEHGLTGMFTTRSDSPSWDWIPPNDLFGMLMPPASDVPEFMPRDYLAQLVEPWTPEEEAEFAPRLTRAERKALLEKYSRRPDRKTKQRPLLDEDFNL